MMFKNVKNHDGYFSWYLVYANHRKEKFITPVESQYGNVYKEMPHKPVFS